MDSRPDKSVRNTKVAHVFETRTNSTPIRQTIRSSHGRIGIWRGRHTLTSGRNQPQKPLKTTPSPHRILLSNVHTNRKELRHLRTRAASGHQSTTELATTPPTHDASFYAHHQSCQPHVLETPSESEPTRCSMVCRTTGLRLRNQTRPRKDTYSRQLPLQTIYRRQRQTRQ